MKLQDENVGYDDKAQETVGVLVNPIEMDTCTQKSKSELSPCRS